MVLVLGFGVAACSKDSSKTSGEAVPSEAPEAAVTRYFAAVKARSCDGLKAASAGSLATTLTKSGCAKVLEDAQHHKLRLVKIVATKKAGRDPRARLVEIEVFAKTQRFLTVRVVPKNGQWALFNL